MQEITQLITLVDKYGIATVLVVLLVVMSYLIIRHILKQSDAIMNMAMAMNEKWQKTIDEHTAQAREFHNQVSEAHKHGRDEHEKIMTSLNQICENSKISLIEHERRKDEHEKMITNLNDITVTLGRINGFKDSH